MRYQGRRAVITGAASGIGAATARMLRAEGAMVGIVDLDADGAEAIAEELGGTALPLDISDIELVASAISALASDLGGFDLLVNSAGWDRAMPFSETRPDFWRQVVEINLLGPMAVTYAALGHMADGGAIVNVSSDAGRVGSSGEVVYSGAKAGVIGFTKALARETASRGIRVNAVAPGPTDTPFLASFDESGKLGAAMERQTPLRKLATAEDVAHAIVFWGSTDAGHITGQVLSVSGGLTMV